MPLDLVGIANIARADKFTRKAERIARETAERLQQAILDHGLPDRAAEDRLVTIARRAAGGLSTGWTFAMISPEQCLVIWEAIWQMPLPDLTRHVFDDVLTRLEPRTGAVTLSRGELAERVGTALR